MATINVSHAKARGLPRAGGPPPAQRRRKAPLGRRVRRNLVSYAFLIGAILCFLLFSWYPMIHEVLLSFQHLNVIGQSEGWRGWRNYQNMVHDPNFWTSVRVTLVFTGLALIFGYAVPFVLAVGLNEFRHAQSYFRLLVYLPVMLPPVAGAFLWKWFYTPDDSGLFNSVLHALHLPTSSWLQSPNNTFAVFCMVVFSTWSNMGSGVLIYMAALQGIPGELYEAAELDGAGVFKRVWHVTIPQTRLILSLMLLTQIVATMQTFTESLALTNGGANGTGTLVYFVYQDATNFHNFGGSAAISSVLLVVLALFSGAYMYVSRRAVEE